MFIRFTVYFGIFAVLALILLLLEGVWRNADIKYEHVQFSKHDIRIRKRIAVLIALVFFVILFVVVNLLNYNPINSVF
ncbi:MAG: hypothetical protein QMD50_03310 [Patescibacteria group bacterium]|nr:hypothetical protein [Patescibacteria group bacterium]